MAQLRAVSLEELQKHATADDCWCAVHGLVYNLTPFLQAHPGGSAIIVKYAGKDATGPFDASGHPRDIVSKLGLDHLTIGRLEQPVIVGVQSEDSQELARRELPPLDHVVNLFDFESLAKNVLNPQAWDYYSSGADDEITLRENHSAFHRIFFRPRVLVNVTSTDLSTTMLGCPSSLPVYITATALGRLAHPDGECALVRAAHAEKILYMLPTLASCTLDEMLQARDPTQPLFYQLYVNHDRTTTARLVQQAEAGGCRALFVTVDAPQLGRREKDMRHKFTLAGSAVQQRDESQGRVARNQGVTRAISSFIDPSLCWDDLEWLRTVTTMPIVLKGVQCGEDAVRAARAGVKGLVCSNHGGRQLDCARSGIEVLAEVMAALREAGLENAVEVYMDGGVRRGTDVLKAVALGARGVGLGRPALYSLATYGQQGVERMLAILRDEMVVAMRLLGVTALAQLTPSFLHTSSVPMHISTVPADHLALANYRPLPVTSKL